MTEQPQTPHKITAKANCRYRPSVFFRKPSGLMRYRHGGYNAVFPLLTGDEWDGFHSPAHAGGHLPNHGGHGGSHGAGYSLTDSLSTNQKNNRKIGQSSAEPMGLVIAFPKK